MAALARVVKAYSPAFGVALDASAERITLVTRSGRVLDVDTALHALAHIRERRVPSAAQEKAAG